MQGVEWIECGGTGEVEVRDAGQVSPVVSWQVMFYKQARCKNSSLFLFLKAKVSRPRAGLRTDHGKGGVVNVRDSSGLSRFRCFLHTPK